jgi:hypothetical protein
MGVDADSLQLFAVPRETIRRLPQDLQASFTPIHLHVGSLARAETMAAELSAKLETRSSAELLTRSSAELEARSSAKLSAELEAEQTEVKLLELTPPSTPTIMDSLVCHHTNFFSPINQSILTPFGPQSYSTPVNSSRHSEDEQLQQCTLYESDTHPEEDNNQAQQEELRPVHRQSARKRGIQPEYSGL